MESYKQMFERITGRKLIKKKTMLNEPIDENLFERISRLYFENRKGFNILKEKTKAMLKRVKHSLLYSIMGYFYYVDGEFNKAARCFKRVIEKDPYDLEPWFCLAFCYRQTGKDKLFDNVIFNLNKISRRHPIE